MRDSADPTFGSQTILTTDDIRQWQEDIQKAERQKADAEAIIADRRRKLVAAATLGVSPSLIPIPPEDDESLHAAVERIGLGFDRLVKHHEIQVELRKSPRFAKMLDRHNGTYYYTVINRLKKDGKIRKVGQHLRFIHNNEAPFERML
jgi:hypothetical protein